VQKREESYRLYSCRGCSVLVSICGACDHGNIYCPGECAAISRRASNRRAGARYQRTRRGARRHAALWAYGLGLALHGYEDSTLEKMAHDLKLEFHHGSYRRSLLGRY
jgi:hypothetical protein